VGVAHKHRRLNEVQRRIVHANQAVGIGAARTKAALKANDPDLEITTRDIYNKTAQKAREMRQGKEPDQALIDELVAFKDKGDIIFEYTINPNTRRIEKIFIADARLVPLNEDPYILLLDCTYKSNKWGMPLLNILGIDGLDQGFTVRVAFLDHETEENFDWAVTQLKACLKPETFPSVVATDCEEALIQALESNFPAIRMI